MKRILSRIGTAPLWGKLLVAGVAIAVMIAVVAAATGNRPKKQTATRQDAELGETETLPPGTVPPTTLVPAIAALTPATPEACRGGDPLANVYHPYRLQVVKPCTTVSGTVETVRHETDDDYHFDLALDPPYAALVNEGNAHYQHGYLVAEIVPADEVGCTPGQPPRPASGTYDYGTCTGSNIPVPAIGAHISVTGPYVIDHEHGWAEIHPVWRIDGGANGAATPASTATESTFATTTGQGSECDPAYPDFCIPPPPPDLNCKDVAPHHNFTVLPPDPHHFDADHNGKGCES